MLINIISQRLPIGQTVIEIFVVVLAMMVNFIIHEMAHGWAAYALGDPTAKNDGRLSFNPMKHIDPFGALLILLAGFGWAKPVMVNPRFFDKPKRDMALTSLAGPMSNFLLAFIAVGLMRLFPIDTAVTYITSASPTVLSVLYSLVFNIALINIGLGLFNLIPIPPLDGSKVLGAFLPDRLYWRFMQIERYGMFVLAGLLMLSRSGYLDVFGFIGAMRNGILSVFAR
ncbi:MAG: site-2 protease family protein, partial [Oscillospiraceae bacterium]|nr:site-2 protease family protein [Oscillospiraceae bacterium]